MEKVTTDVVEIATEPELKVQPKDMTKLLKSQGKTSTGEELFLMDYQRKLFCEMETTPGEDSGNTVEM